MQNDCLNFCFNILFYKFSTILHFINIFVKLTDALKFILNRILN